MVFISPPFKRWGGGRLADPSFFFQVGFTRFGQASCFSVDRSPCLFGGRAVNGAKRARQGRPNMPSVLTWPLLLMCLVCNFCLPTELGKSSNQLLILALSDLFFIF
jgi:hypothetical protein